MHGPSGRRVGAAEFELSFATQAQGTRASQPARILSSTPRNRFAARALRLSDDLNPPSSVANASPASGRPQQGRLPASQSGADRSSRAARTDRRSVRRVRQTDTPAARRCPISHVAEPPRCRRGLDAQRAEAEISLHFFSSPLDPTRVTH